MRILKTGYVKGTIEVECNNCRASLEVEAKDVDYTPGREQEPNEAFYVECPCCYNRIGIEKARIPLVFYGRMKS